MLVAVTGASGFVGRHLCEALGSSGHSVRALVRRQGVVPGGFVIGDLGGEFALGNALDGVGCLVHTAARVHAPRVRGEDSKTAFYQVNVRGTELLARHAAAAGVRRLVFVSSIGVLGSCTPKDARFHSSSLPAPTNPYSVSKLEAEKALQEIAGRTGLEWVIVRPPLIYGPRAPGNFASLLQVLGTGLPLPFASIDNLRSMIGIENLVELLALCVTHRGASGQILLASDGEDVSTPDLIHRLCTIMGRPARLFPCPHRVLELLGRLTGRAGEIQGLVRSLQIDSSGTRDMLGWRPSRGLDEGLRNAVLS